jgi:hypothetical protein
MKKLVLETTAPFQGLPECRCDYAISSAKAAARFNVRHPIARSTRIHISFFHDDCRHWHRQRQSSAAPAWRDRARNSTPRGGR